MDTEQLEKQLSIWNRLMYVALGSALTLVFSSPNDFSYIGIVWFLILIASILSGFFLLWGKRWKALPVSKEKTSTAFGFLIASWLSLLLMLILDGTYTTGVIVFCYTTLLALIYWLNRKKLSGSDEMFP
jgi:hypothetical protein